MLLAILEKALIINAVYSGEDEHLGVGTVAAGYQNFLICIEMLLAAIALRFAYPYSLYAQGPAGISQGRTVSLQSISSNLKETMNPKDIMADAIHNFHPQYQQYVQQSSRSRDDVDLGVPATPTNYGSNSQSTSGTRAPLPPTTKTRFNEKTTLLSSDEEFP